MRSCENIAFDQYQRYETISRLIDFRRAGRDADPFDILELGANEHKNLGLFLPVDKILYTDVNLSETMANDPQFCQADGTDLPFADNSFDFVIAADVLEHIPAERRQRFLTEAYRVARIGAIISFPNDTQDVIDAENRVNVYYKAIAGDDFIWLKEHSLCGLPSREEISDCLRKKNIPFFMIQHGEVHLWEKIWYAHFNAVFMPETVAYREEIDRYYNTNLYKSDVAQSCYRTFLILGEGTDKEWERAAGELWSACLSQETLRFLDVLLQKPEQINGLSRTQRIETLERECTRLSASLDYYKSQHTALVDERDAYKQQYITAAHERDICRQQLHSINNAFFWRITKPARVLVNKTRELTKKSRFLTLLAKGFSSVRHNGIRATWKKVSKKLGLRKESSVHMLKPTKREQQRQKTFVFPQNIKFSIVVPLYNTPPKFLKEMIESVQNQTYQNWELCMADGSDRQHADVEKFCRKYTEKDSRIRYKKLDQNYGISGNTNACLDMATGDYIGLFDHDDLLHPCALFEVMTAICEKGADFIYTDENTFHHTPDDAFCPHFKPDYAPDTLRANNYICHFTVFKRALLDIVGGFDSACDGSQDFDMVLRLTEQAKCIVHIPKVLYYWRAHANSVADSVGAKPYVIQAAHRAIENHLKRIGLEGEVLDSAVPSMYRLKYAIKGEPLVSIIIPNQDHISDLEKCLNSICNKSTYSNYEIIIVENNSKDPKTFDYYSQVQKMWPNVKVVEWKSYFNYSAINNYGKTFANGEHILLLNNDTEVISPDWIQEMLMYSQRADVGAVGAKLYYPDDTIQHAGVGIGLLTLAGHLHRGFERNHPGYMGRLIYAQNLSAVTAACIMIRADVWEQIGGLDETFEVAFNDIDLCMRIRKAGFLIVWTPFAELYHYESKSRGLEDTPEKQKRFQGEIRRFHTRWATELAAGDPYYNPNFSLDKEDFTVL